jgi:phosphohistidine swiveling domain-containing protein
VKNLDEIVKLGWAKRWSIPYSLLACSYAGIHYIKTCHQDLGKGFEHILFTHRKGVSTCYRVRSETANFGDYLAKQAVKKPELILGWSTKLKEQSDIIRSIMAKDSKIFLKYSSYQKFEKAYRDYHPWAIANNTVPDYLSSDLFKKYKKTLEEARVYSEKIFDETENFFLKVLSLLAKKKEYQTNQLLSLYQDELNQFYQSGILPDKESLTNRYDQSVIYFDGAKKYILSLNQVNQFESLIVETSGSKSTEIKGVVASRGKAIGTCQIIRDPRQVDIFNDGDIIITGMTRPEFVPLMKKAGAIVTDAGGVLSHAAIVSRELKKPCIIGTEVATNIFKDGDKVEVDAYKGVVKKIN